MYKFFFVFLCISSLLLAQGCIKKTPLTSDPFANFDSLWHNFDRHYGLFARKHIDWRAVGEKYRARLHANMGSDAFFFTMADMLSELKDAHVALVSSFNSFTYRNFFLEVPQNYDANIVTRAYLGAQPRTFAGLSTQILQGQTASSMNTVGMQRTDSLVLYISYTSFDAPVTSSALNLIASYVEQFDMRGVIVDIRNNGGGDIANAQRFAGFFASAPYVGAYLRFKTGAGHTDFSKTFSPIMANPASRTFTKPVIVLTNRMVYSAANLFAAMVKTLPNVTLLGDTTGGGGGIPRSGTLPNGWVFNLSSDEMFDTDRRPLELGVAPDIRSALDVRSLVRDNMIDTAFRLINEISRRGSR